VEHNATITETKRFPNLPWEAQCSCGTAGSFKDKGQAVSYMQDHHRKGSSNDTHEITFPEPAKPVMAKPLPVPPAQARPVPPAPVHPVVPVPTPVVPKTEQPIETVDTPQEHKS
jgi:hypothetical protein